MVIYMKDRGVPIGMTPVLFLGMTNFIVDSRLCIDVYRIVDYIRIMVAN